MLAAFLEPTHLHCSQHILASLFAIAHYKKSSMAQPSRPSLPAETQELHDLNEGPRRRSTESVLSDEPVVETQLRLLTHLSEPPQSKQFRLMTSQQTTQRATCQHDRLLCLHWCGPFLAVRTRHLSGGSRASDIRLPGLRLNIVVRRSFFGRDDSAFPSLRRSVRLSLPICRRRGRICLRLAHLVRQASLVNVDDEINSKQVFMDSHCRLGAACRRPAIQVQIQSGVSGREWLCS